MRPINFEGSEALRARERHPVTTLLLVMAAGSIGVGLRFLLDGLITMRLGDGFPWSTLVINILGAFAIGIVATLLATSGDAQYARVALGIGLLGGFTTYSAFALESVSLAQAGEWTKAVAYIGTTNVLGLSACIAGIAVARTVT